MGINTTDGKSVKFRLAAVELISPNFLVVAPFAATTPQTINIGLNPVEAANLQPGRSYVAQLLFTTVDEDPPSTARATVRYTAPAKPAPVVGAVQNSASRSPYLSPGALITILGSDLAAPTLTGNYDVSASYPRRLGNTTVTIGGIEAPLLYVSPSQINAILPFELAGRENPEVVVTHFDKSSTPVRVAVLDTSPGIFTMNQMGTGQAVARQLALDRSAYSFNSAENPAVPGQAFEMYLTGAGLWDVPTFGDIRLSPAYLLFTRVPVSVTIGGVAAQILYAGPPGGQQQLPWGYVQVNAVVPEGVGSGPQPLVLKIGSNDSSAQQRTTIAIR